MFSQSAWLIAPLKSQMAICTSSRCCRLALSPVAVQHSFRRLYSSPSPPPSPQQQHQHQQQQQKKKRRGNNLLPLLLLGIAAGGLTYYNLKHVSKPPRASVDPIKVRKELESTEKPLFHPGEIDVIFVLGGPGAGKGTQCQKLVDQYHFVHLSAGDLLRAEQKDPDSQYGELIADCIKEGIIVPQEITIALLRKAIVKNYNSTGKTRFLVDGFPRKMDQALSFEDQVAQSKFVLFFECPEDVMLERLLQRGKTSGRSDDNIESIKKRFRTFLETSMPVINYYEKKGKVVKVNCDRPVDEVFDHVVSHLEKEGISKN
ncbi:bifunctional uridylate/adenylate kinase [Brettanomyces nanus]|uniref:Uridylate kinase n=1 Tax=Eeniella nana TaxID=13502 RepID=A0A875RQJ1_EENNA|nr:bifunctional uridylate/adenylate kinase [Brettanomyces nanus]QPG77140.1 bifunctional uridylate/adenylate kinase [Brettanomyces nanus]